MIVISQHGKPLVKVESWEDLFTRPGFIDKVDPKRVKLKEIIGQYRLGPEPNPCGLKTCQQPHNRGYIVLLEDGNETNIGGDCGKRIFGVEFEGHERAFKRIYNAQRSREVMQAAQNRIESIRADVAQLRVGDYGADALYTKMHALMSRQFDEQIERALKERAKAGRSVVARVRQLTKEEIEDLEVIGDNRTTEETPIFTINGLAAVKDYGKLKLNLKTRLGTELDAFEALNPDELNLKKLREWSNWSNRIDNRLKEARDIMEDCKRFLMASNLEQIRSHKRLL